MEISVTTGFQNIINEYPFLSDLLIESYPMLKKINNPIYRRTILKTSTIAQVAASVSIDPDDLAEFIRGKIHTGNFPGK